MRSVISFRSWAVTATSFLFLCSILWLALSCIAQAYPYIQPGADLIVQAKNDVLAKQSLFGAGDRLRVLAFGNSRTLAGFRPDVFERELGPGARAFNFGLPAQRRFLPTLESLLAAGNRPTHILLQQSWEPQTSPPSWRDRLRDDKDIISALVPFRNFPRNLLVFFLRSASSSSRDYYQRGRAEVKRMLSQQGWYYLKDKSLYPSGELPADYHTAEDDPTRLCERAVPADSWQLRELKRLQQAYNFKVDLVPEAYRVGEHAPARPRPEPRIISRLPVIKVLGPDCFLYPPADFSDGAHMNPRGSELHTRALAELFKADLRSE